MVIILFVLTIIFLILRIIFFQLARGKGLGYSLIKLFGDVHTLNIFFPIKKLDAEDIRTKKYKQMANAFLILFFFSFLALIIYGLITELPKFE